MRLQLRMVPAYSRGGLVDIPADLGLRELEPDPFRDLG